MPEPRLTFGPALRLSGRRAFRRVFDEGTRAHKFPLTLWAAPNALPHCRLGLSIGRRVGNAPRRSRLKRRLREAFRLSQHDLPAGYDLVIAAKPHDDLPPERYIELLTKLARRTTSG